MNESVHMFFKKLSRRAGRVVLEARRTAGSRGADSIGVNDLVIALITEEQDPNSLELDEEHPDVKRYLEKELRPAAVGFQRTCFIQRDSFFAPEVAADLLAKLNEILPRSNSIPTTSGMHTSPEFQRAFDVAESLRNKFRQNKVHPLHLLAAVLREPCQPTPTLQEAGITEENVLHALGRGSESE
jgi:ATP-dependent Clp protease ATP-binding subunit ClpA